MTRLAEIPRVRLTPLDRSDLAGVAAQYEFAQGVYENAAEALKSASAPDVRRGYRLQAQANKVRASAVTDLMLWANRALTEAAIGVGFPKGSAHPRLKKAYDAGWDHRRWGSAGCAREAARTIRRIVKRGWI